jgi:uncharacterized repeat protein (TIGR01451 family)
MPRSGRAFAFSLLLLLISSPIFGEAQSALRFVAITPCRVVDTRWLSGPFGGPAIQGGTFRSFAIPNGPCQIPNTAAAYSLNVTVVPHSTLGYLTVWPTSQQMPIASTLNSLDGRIKANAAIVAAGEGGAISIFASDTTDVALDINGYFVPATTQALEFYPLAPCRVADTRNANGPLGGPYLQARQERDFPVLSAAACNIPPGAAAYSLNFTAVPLNGGPLSYLTVWPMGQPQPTTSLLNALTGTITANAGIVQAGTGGQISTYVTNNTNLVIDIDGYFAAPQGSAGLTLYALTPCRVLDTRKGVGAFSGKLPVDVADSNCGAPSAAQAYVFNATVVPQGPLGYLTLWPDGQQQPLVSTLNALDGAITSNMAVVPTQNGWVDAYAPSLTQLVLDISSYFGPITPAITTTTLPAAVLGTPYSATLQAAGGFPPYTWSITQGTLPLGLTLNANGTISGTSTQLGLSNFTVKAVDTQNQVATAALSITVQQPAPLQITTTSLSDGIVGQPYSAALSATGGVPPYTWSLQSGTLPPGLTLSSTGFITGTPTAAGSSYFEVKVTDSESPSQSALANLGITVDPNPPPVLSNVYPSSAPLGSSAVTLQLYGSGFNPGSVVQWNGNAIPTVFQNSTQLQATLPASDLQSLGNNVITVYNAPPEGGQSAAQGFTVYLPLQTNDLVYNPSTQLFYASIPSAAGPTLGNSIVSIDPVTGALGNPIWVGSEPNKLAISGDGTVLWVGLDGAASVREVNLTTSTAGLQFSLGGGSGVYDPPFTAGALAVMPGNPNTVAVSILYNGSSTAIYDSGVKRPATDQNSFNVMTFSPSGNEIYAVQTQGGYYVLTVGSTGITNTAEKNSSVYSFDLRYANGRSYLSDGAVLDAEQGTLLGTFYVSGNQNASGALAVDATLGRAWILNGGYEPSTAIGTFDISTFVLDGNIPIGMVTNDGSPGSEVYRWGPNGLAFRVYSGLFFIESPLVQDLSQTPADLSITATGPATGSTGTNLTYNLTVSNSGPSTATPVAVTDNIPQGTVFNSATASQGSCSGGHVVQCNLGAITDHGTVRVTLVVSALDPGAVQNTAQVSAAQPDPNQSNNSVSTQTVLSGSTYNPVPAITGLSPNVAQAGSGAQTVAVNGSQFTSTSVVLWNGAALPTSFVSSTQLTAHIAGSLVAAQGWAWVSVSNPAPGGGATASLPFTIDQLVSLDAADLVFDPFTRKLYASVPSTAPQLQGNSIVSIDPSTGAIGTPVNIGSQPGPMAESDDGQWLYVILQGSNTLARYNLVTRQRDPVTYSLTPPNYIQGIGITPRGVAVLPGTNSSVDVDLGSFYGNGLLDIANGTGIFRPDLTGTYSGGTPAFADATHLFTWDFDDSGNEFYRYSLSSSGFTRIDGSTVNGIGGMTGFRLNGDTVFGGTGGLINASTTPPQQLAIYNLSDPFGGGGIISGTSVSPDVPIDRVFYLANPPGWETPLVLSYDQSRYTFINMLNISGNDPGPNMVRWGQDGLAFQAGDTPSDNPGEGQLFLLHGGFVLPEWGTSNPTPSLTSLSPSSRLRGSGNFYLTVTGSNFVPGAVGMWNGSARTTTYVDSQHLKAAIAAADINSPGTATVTVVNPNSAPSGGLTFTIN